MYVFNEILILMHVLEKMLKRLAHLKHIRIYYILEMKHISLNMYQTFSK